MKLAASTGLMVCVASLMLAWPLAAQAAEGAARAFLVSAAADAAFIDKICQRP